jgi:ABC-2 type transport system permease protein
MAGGFFERGQASLDGSFFMWHPWLYLFLVPAVGMRLWAEERRVGTLELLLTLPITAWQAIVGKFLASWIFCCWPCLTFPVVITVNYLGSPDNGVIFAGYVGSFLMAGAYLAISCMTSAMTRNQVVSFILSVVICLFLVLCGFPPVTNLLTRMDCRGWSTRWRPSASSRILNTSPRACWIRGTSFSSCPSSDFPLFTTGVIIRSHRAG